MDDIEVYGRGETDRLFQPRTFGMNVGESRSFARRCIRAVAPVRPVSALEARVNDDRPGGSRSGVVEGRLYTRPYWAASSVAPASSLGSNS